MERFWLEFSAVITWLGGVGSDEGIVVITANVRIHSPDVGPFQFSHSPPRPNGSPSFMVIA